MFWSLIEIPVILYQYPINCIENHFYWSKLYLGYYLDTMYYFSNNIYNIYPTNYLDTLKQNGTGSAFCTCAKSKVIAAGVRCLCEGT